MQLIAKSKSPITALVDVVIDLNSANFWLQKFNPLWSMNQALGVIRHKETVAQDTVSLTIQCNRHFQAGQAGQAGQHHPVFVTIAGVRYERSYSLTQLDSQHMLLTVKKVDQGTVSSWLVEQANVGDVVEFGQPYGDMCVPEQKSLILLAAGSGITPMYSLLKQMLHTNPMQQTQIQLMYWVKKYEDCAFQSQFEAWAQQYSNFSFSCFFTQEQPADARLNAEHIQQWGDLKNTAVYACGPSAFAAQVNQLCADAAVLKTEAFSMTPIANDDVGLVNITLLKSNKVIAIAKGQPILTSLEQQNIQAKHGCRMGICNKCACHKVEGSTRNLLNGMQNNQPGNLLKICVNSAQTDLTLDL